MRMIIGAVVLLAGLSSVANGQAVSDQPKIVVDGYGEVKTIPDVATISYTIRGEGTTSDDAVRAMVAAGSASRAISDTSIQLLSRRQAKSALILRRTMRATVRTMMPIHSFRKELAPSLVTSRTKR